MADAADRYEIHLEGGAGEAVSQIVDYLRALRGGKGDVTPEEAVQRALGTELYLLKMVRQEGATITVESKQGRVELDLSE